METTAIIGNEVAVNESTLNPVQEEETMSTVTNDVTEAAADQSDLNPVTTDNSVNNIITDDTSDQDTNDASEQIEAGEEGATTTTTINPETVSRLFELLEKATNSPFYMSNEKRVTALLEALKIPVSDDVSFQRLFYYAEKDLFEKAYKDARGNGQTPEEVTTAMIMAEATARYIKKNKKLPVVNEEYEV